MALSQSSGDGGERPRILSERIQGKQILNTVAGKLLTFVLTARTRTCRRNLIGRLFKLYNRHGVAYLIIFDDWRRQSYSYIAK